MKGYFEDDRNIPFIAFKLIFTEMPNDEQIGKIASSRQNNIASDRVVKEIEQSKTQPFLLLFTRYQDKWMQWSVRPYCTRSVIPSFLVDFYVRDYDHEAQINVINEEQGFSNLQELIRGGTARDHHGIEWKLAPDVEQI